MHNDKLDIAQILRRIPLFQELSQEQIDHLAAQTREKRLHKGEMLDLFLAELLEQGDSAENLSDVELVVMHSEILTGSDGDAALET